MKPIRCGHPAHWIMTGTYLERPTKESIKHYRARLKTECPAFCALIGHDSELLGTLFIPGQAHGTVTINVAPGPRRDVTMTELFAKLGMATS